MKVEQGTIDQMASGGCPHCMWGGPSYAKGDGKIPYWPNKWDGFLYALYLIRFGVLVFCLGLLDAWERRHD